MREQHPVEEWRERHASQVLYVMASVAGGLALAGHSGVLPLDLVSPELLDGFALGACIGVVVSRLAGGPLPEKRRKVAPPVKTARAGLPDSTELQSLSAPVAAPLAHASKGRATGDAPE